MGYAIVEEVEVGFRTLTQEERERTAALLEEAALVIDAYGKDADPDVKRLVSCRMVRRLPPGARLQFYRYRNQKIPLPGGVCGDLLRITACPHWTRERSQLWLMQKT